MSNERVRQLLTELRSELDRTELDDATRSLAKELDDDIHGLLDNAGSTHDSGSILERARIAETNFATNHPVAERFVREIIDTLARMGI